MLNIDPEGLGIRLERRCLGTGSAGVLEQAARYGGEGATFRGSGRVHGIRQVAAQWALRAWNRHGDEGWIKRSQTR